jgi:hydrogenase/urease accessory protein HupE
VKRLALFLVLLAPFAPSAFAHEVRPAYLELRLSGADSTGADTYDVLWKVPAQGEDLRLGLYVELPAGCRNVTEPRGATINGGHVERWKVTCASGLKGGRIHIAGLSVTMTDTLVRVEGAGGRFQTARLTPSAPSFTVEASAGTLAVARTYLLLGVEHILTGFDHLLFVLALVLLVKGTGRLVAAITAFTLAHSLTLAAATLGFVHVPGPPVEAAIALSIVFMAAEVVRARLGHPGLAVRSPWIVAFGFGLLHGLGFASALSDVGLPPTAIPVALFFFNVGVEIGQLLFIAAVLAVIALAQPVARRLAPLQPAWTWHVPAYAIGGIASFWTFQRIAAF